MGKFDEFFHYVIEDIRNNQGFVLLNLESEIDFHNEFLEESIPNPQNRKTVKEYLRLVLLLRDFEEWSGKA